MILKILFLFILSIVLAGNVSAHCPLCTIGAGAAAAGAVWLGVSKVVVALFIGGFAMSMGMWFARVVKKRYVPFQKTLIILIVFLTTVLPLLPLFTHTAGFHVDLTGGYGSLLNRTYVVNHSLFSSLFGGMIVFFSPALSGKITKLRNGKMIPFQGIALTLLSLIVVGAIIQLAM